MKIPESIISKYQLVPTGNHIGEAVMHNLEVFKSKLPGFEGILFMECDFNGRPCDYITLFNTRLKKPGKVTPEFLTDLTSDWVLKLMKD